MPSVNSIGGSSGSGLSRNSWSVVAGANHSGASRRSSQSSDWDRLAEFSGYSSRKKVVVDLSGVVPDLRGREVKAGAISPRSSVGSLSLRDAVELVSRLENQLKKMNWLEIECVDQQDNVLVKLLDKLTAKLNSLMRNKSKKSENEVCRHYDTVGLYNRMVTFTQSAIANIKNEPLLVSVENFNSFFRAMVRFIDESDCSQRIKLKIKKDLLEVQRTYFKEVT